MKARLSKLWSELLGSYWFLPSLMALAAIAGALATGYIDNRVSEEFLERWSTLRGSTPDGARTVLATIAGSMMGVAGVSFSITIASVVYASGSHGPRLLTNFMADRGNQITLGTFIATFVYCLIVLRTVTGESGDSAAFVPQFSLGVALALSLASIGVLIYFIHHVPDTIHISNLTSRIGQELLESIDRNFQSENNALREPRREYWTEACAGDVCATIPAPRSGYLQAVEISRLVSLGREHDCMFKAHFRPGDWLTEGIELVDIYTEDGVDVSEGLHREIGRLFVIGNKRTPLQDSRLLLSQIAEIAVRALSPGVNDPRSAMDCVDWMSAAIQRFDGARFPAGIHQDGAEEWRARMPAANFGDFMDASFQFIRPYVARDPNVALHTLRRLESLSQRSARSAHRLRLDHEYQLLVAAALHAAPDETSRAWLRAQCERESAG